MENFSRISGAPWFKKMQNLYLTIIGAGGIGSHLAYSLSRLNPFSMYIYDGDIIETGNQTGQLYSKNDINLIKSFSIADFINNYSSYSKVSSYNNYLWPGSIDENGTKVPSSFASFCEPITFLALDSMEARKNIVEHFKTLRQEENDNAPFLLMDGRLSAEEFQIFTMQSFEDIEKYQNSYLFEDVDADSVICSYKQTTYSAMMIAGLMTNLFVNYIYNMYVAKGPIRRLPFLTEVECPSLTFKLV